MQITFIRDDSAFEAMGAEWNALLKIAAVNVPFLRHEYLSTWWSTFGGGEWTCGELSIGVARSEDGALMGVAPLFFTRTHDGQPGLMFLGSVEISDYLDFIAPADVLPEFVEALFGALDREGPAGWEVLDLYNVLEDSPVLTLLEGAARRRGWKTSEKRLQPCPRILLDGDWDGYMARLNKKQRHELRRKMRRAEAHPMGIRWRIVGPGEDIDAALETFIGLMAYDEGKAAFLTQVMRSQLRRSVRVAHENGWSQLAFLEVGGEMASGLLNFDYEERVWVYNSGFNPAYLSLSPGWVQVGYLIRWAIEHGRREVDFLRGDEDYKYRLGGVERYVVRMTIRR